MPLVRRCARAGPVASGTLLTLPSFYPPSRGSHHICEDLPAEPWCGTAAQRAGGAGSAGRRPLRG